MPSYLLKLRELHCRLWRHDPDSAPSDVALRDQLLLGLREGARRSNVYVRRNPDETFAAVHQEALLLDSERGNSRPEVTCASVSNPYVSAQTQDASWKETLKREIMEDVKLQIAGITQELLREIKPLIQPLGIVPQSPVQTVREQWRFPAHTNSWDEQGRPICRRCRQTGHMARFCRQAVASQQALN